MFQSLLDREQPTDVLGRPLHAPDVERKAERFRQILAHIDFALTIEIEKLERRDGDPDTVPALIGVLKEAHRMRRDPYLRKLADLAVGPTGHPATQGG